MPITEEQNQDLTALCEQKAIHPISLFVLFGTYDQTALTEEDFHSYYNACKLIKQNGEESNDEFYKDISPDIAVQVFAYKPSNNRRRIFYIQWKNSSLKVILFDGPVGEHTLDNYRQLIDRTYKTLMRVESNKMRSPEEAAPIWSIEEAKEWASRVTGSLTLQDNVATAPTVTARHPLEILSECENYANSLSTLNISPETYRLTLTTIATLHDLIAIHTEIQTNPTYELCMELLLQNWIRCILHYFHWTPYIEKGAHEYVFNTGNNKLGQIKLFSNLEQVKTVLERIVVFALTPDRFSNIDSQKILTVVFVSHTKLVSSLGIGLFFELWKRHYKLNELIAAISFNHQEKVLFELVKLLQTSDLNMAHLHTESIDSLTKAICLFLSLPSSHQTEFEDAITYLPVLLKRATQRNILHILSIMKNNDDIPTPVLIRLANTILENEQYAIQLISIMINRAYLLRLRRNSEAGIIVEWIRVTLSTKSDSNSYFTLQLYSDIDRQTQIQLKGMGVIDLDSIIGTSQVASHSLEEDDRNKKQIHEQNTGPRQNKKNKTNPPMSMQSVIETPRATKTTQPHLGHYQPFYDRLCEIASKFHCILPKTDIRLKLKVSFDPSLIYLIEDVFMAETNLSSTKNKRKKAKLFALTQAYNAFLGHISEDNPNIVNLNKIIYLIINVLNNPNVSIKPLFKITSRFANPALLKGEEYHILNCALEVIAHEIKRHERLDDKIGEECLLNLLSKGISFDSYPKFDIDGTPIGSHIHQVILRNDREVIEPLLRLLVKYGINPEITEVGYHATSYDSLTPFCFLCMILVDNNQAMKKGIQGGTYSRQMISHNPAVKNINSIFASNSELNQRVRLITESSAYVYAKELPAYDNRYEEAALNQIKILFHNAQVLIELGAKSDFIIRTQQHIPYNLADLALTFEYDELVNLLNQLHCTPLAKRNPHLIMYTPHYNNLNWIAQWFELHTKFRNSLTDHTYEEYIQSVLSVHKEYYSMSSLSFILIAIEMNHYEAVKFILDNSNPSLFTTFLRIPNSMNIEQENCITAIEYGLERGYFETIEKLLSHYQGHITLVNEQGSSLHALFRGLSKLRDCRILPTPTYSDIAPVLEALMRAGASFDQEMNDQPVIRFGISSGFGDLIRSILQNKSKLETLRTQPSFPDAHLSVAEAGASATQTSRAEASSAEATASASEQEGAYATRGPDDDSDDDMHHNNSAHYLSPRRR